jgi:tRNA-modifying protein YgfZ
MSMQLFEFSIAGVVRVSGEDALPYLQSQLTINLNQIPVLGTRPGLRLSLKGKVLFGAQVIRTGEEEYLLVCRETPASAVMGLLEENIVADEVEFTDLSNRWKLSSLFHPSSMNEILAISGIGELSPNEARQIEKGWAFLNPSLPGKSLSFLHPSDSSHPWPNDLLTADSTELEYLRLQENLFRPGLEIGDTEFPQEGGLEENSVDFDKGCYLGQEVMARIHAMGKVRKQAVAVRGTGKPELPCPLFKQGKSVGTLKSQFPLRPGDAWIGTAVVHQNALSELHKEGLPFENSHQRVQILS